MTAGTAVPYREVACGCGQLIARCWPGGTIRVVVVSEQGIEPNGQYWVRCPKCEHKVRFRPIRRQMLQ